MKRLKISEKWYVDCEDANNCTLVFEESRERKKKDTGEMESYLYKDEYFYPSVQTALIRYLQLCQENTKDVRECIELTRTTFEQIKQLKF